MLTMKTESTQRPPLCSVPIYPNATNRGTGTKHKLSIQRSQMFGVTLLVMPYPCTFAVSRQEHILPYTSRLTGPSAPAIKTLGSWFPTDISMSEQPLRKQHYQKLLMVAKKEKERSGTGGDGKRQESSLQFLSLPISLLAIHWTPFYPLMFLLIRQAWK